MCLTGVDYFSTLGYQPSIAVEAAGVLAPLATLILVLVTLFGALPVYIYVAKHSPHGQGSIGMLEKLVKGWWGKTFVLVMLGFAATDYVITKTLSAADAAEHIVSNPIFFRDQPVPEGLSQQEKQEFEKDQKKQHEKWQIGITIGLLIALGAMFLRGFREVIGVAIVIVGIYLLLSGIIIGSGLVYLLNHPEYFRLWWEHVQTGTWHLHETPFRSTEVWGIIAIAILLFPKLALGLSGFETGVAVMGHVKGDATDTVEKPTGRIRNTRKLLITAAAIMSIALLSSSLVVAMLIPPGELVYARADGSIIDPVTQKEITLHEAKLSVKKPAAKDRALAYIAHAEGETGKINPLFGNVFGTIYDISTVIILWFAGASAMAGLLNLVPQYLPRYGMAPEWTRAARWLVVLFTGVNVVVTILFKANVDDQGGAYATGVLMLITSACVATVIGKYRQATGTWLQRLSIPYTLVMLVFVYTTIANIIEKPSGIKIAFFFIVAIVLTSLLSRVVRSRELRFIGFDFANDQSRFLWESIRASEWPILVPHRPGRRSLEEKEKMIRREHRLPENMPILFIEVELHDASDFYQQPVLEVLSEEGRYMLKITRSASIAHTLAAVVLELAKVGKPPEIHFGWTEESPVAGMIGFLLFGEGNVPWMVHELISEAEPDPAKRPAVMVGGV
ncbi:MAG: amino acid transporter [Planctomycetia bacterium]|nr:amino acid transporter [Planctomycetia bacterium]